MGGSFDLDGANVIWDGTRWANYATVVVRSDEQPNHDRERCHECQPGCERIDR